MRLPTATQRETKRLLGVAGPGAQVRLRRGMILARYRRTDPPAL
jgi:hypothetical protein